MIFILGIFAAGIFAFFLWFIMTYNSLVSLRNHVAESWSGIDTELKRRYDLIPNLVDTVKGYAHHEQETFVRVAEARKAAISSSGSPGSQAKDENALVGSLKQLLVVAEGYPDLKASDNFLRLQTELSNTEDRIQAARRFYNGNVRDQANAIEMFPSSLIANAFGFKKSEFFEVEDSRSVPVARF